MGGAAGSIDGGFFWFGAWIGAVWVEDWRWLAFGLDWLFFFLPVSVCCFE